jgi:hypothetical protein
MRNFLGILLVLLVASCSPAGGTLWPTPMLSGSFPPPGPPNYQQGMMDGCRTAQGAVGNSIYGAIHAGVHYDVDKALNDRVYYKAWKDAYFYCKYEHDKGPE